MLSPNPYSEIYKHLIGLRCVHNVFIILENHSARGTHGEELGDILVFQVPVVLC